MPRSDENRGEPGRRSSRRRWLLRAQFTFSVSVLAASALIAYRMYQRQAAITRLLQFHSSLTAYYQPDRYAYEPPPMTEAEGGSFTLVFRGGQRVMGFNVQDEPSPLQHWVVSIIGEQFCTELVQVYVSGEQFQDADVKLLRALPCLREVRLNGTQIGDNGLQEIANRWRRLTVLELSQTRITDVGLQSLDQLEELRELDVSRTAVSSSALEQFRERHPDCLVFD